jgi:hypothetical protein
MLARHAHQVQRWASLRAVCARTRQRGLGHFASVVKGTDGVARKLEAEASR